MQNRIMKKKKKKLFHVISVITIEFNACAHYVVYLKMYWIWIYVGYAV